MLRSARGCGSINRCSAERRCCSTPAFALRRRVITCAYEDQLESAVRAVRLAGALTSKVQQQLRTQDQVSKDDASPVTVADYGAQCLVTWSLLRDAETAGLTDSGRITMIGEEDSADLRVSEGAGMRSTITKLVNEVLTGETGAPQISEEEMMDLVDMGDSGGGPIGQHWVLDPIDGTRGFVGMRQYAICLGLLDEGEVVAGVLGCPNLPSAAVTAADGQAGDGAPAASGGVLFQATRGGGAFSSHLTDPADSPTQLHAGDLSDPSAAIFMESFESRHSDHVLSADIATALGIDAPSVRMDSQVKYGCLARGDAQVFMRFPPSTYREKIWDHAAGVVILQEAGLLVSDASGNPLDFSRGKWLDLDRGIVAGPPTVHTAIIDTIRDLRPKS